MRIVFFVFFEGGINSDPFSDVLRLCSLERYSIAAVAIRAKGVRGRDTKRRAWIAYCVSYNKSKTKVPKGALTLDSVQLTSF